jgi:hypothetical protein
MVIETRTGTQPDEPIAFQTVVQLDGDRLMSVDLHAMEALSHYQRLRLAVSHRVAVRDKVANLFGTFHRVIAWFRRALIVCFGVIEVGSVWTGVMPSWGVIQIDWRALARDQILCVAPLVTHKLVPYGVRAWHAVARKGLSAERRTDSEKSYRVSGGGRR